MERIATALAAQHHILLTGSTTDLIFAGEHACQLPQAIQQFLSQLFPVVLSVNAIDRISIVHGFDAFERHRTQMGLPTGTEFATPDTPVPLRAHTEPAIMDVVRSMLTQDQVNVAVVVEQADILLQDPDVHDVPERNDVAALQLALRDATSWGHSMNTAILLANTIDSIPAVLRQGVQLEHIGITPPSRVERHAVIQSEIHTAHGAAELTDTELNSVVELLSDLTDGDTLQQVRHIVNYSREGHISIDDPRELIRRFRHGPRPDYWSHINGNLESIEKQLNERVFGQPHAISTVMKTLAKASLGFSFDARNPGREGKPRGAMTLVGPTGTGKTELAKAIAEVCFGDAEAYVRLDMAGFAHSHDVARLIGSPPGYVGHTDGGQLTNPVLVRPATVILLDEIEKAAVDVHRLLLSILEDGHVTDARGRKVYFSEAIIVMTSNIGADRVMDAVVSRGFDISYDEVRSIAIAAVDDFFSTNQLPEFFGRIEPEIVAFDILRPEAIEQIVDKLIKGFGFLDGPSINFDQESVTAFIQERLREPAALKLGGRQVRNEFQDLAGHLALWISKSGLASSESIRLSIQDGQMYARTGGNPTVHIPLTI